MNKRSARHIAVLRASAVAICGAWLAVGCSAPERLSKTDYEQAVVSAYEDVRQAFAETRVEAAEVRAERLAAAQAALRNAAKALMTLRPPATAESANRELAEAWQAYADDLDDLRAAILRDDTEFQQRFNERVATHPAVLRAREAAEELKESGFQLGMLAKD